MQTQDHPDHQVFTFCGHVVDDDVRSLKSGYVVAETPQNAIEGMREFGFRSRQSVRLRRSRKPSPSWN